MVAITLGLLPRLETGRRLALIAAAVAVALAMLFAPGVGDLLTERLNTAIESGGTGRTAIWAVGLNVVPEHPIIGIGYGDFPSVINPENVRATILPVQTDVLDFPIGPHNIVVGVLVELGIVGLILLFGVARSLFRGRARSEAAVLARAVMIGFAVQSLFLGIANLKQVWLFVAIALGLAAAERLGQAATSAGRRDGGRRRRHRRAAPGPVRARRPAGRGAGARGRGRGCGTAADRTRRSRSDRRRRSRDAEGIDGEGRNRGRHAEAADGEAEGGRLEEPAAKAAPTGRRARPDARARGGRPARVDHRRDDGGHEAWAVRDPAAGRDAGPPAADQRGHRAAGADHAPAVRGRGSVTDDDRPRSVDWLTPNYPWAADPIPGSFHRTQARAVVRAGVGVRVIAPTPFAPFPLSRASERWRRYAAAPKRQTDESVEIVRPRYLAIPGEPGWAQVSRSVAAAARGAIGSHPAPLIHAHFITPGGMAARRLTREHGPAVRDHRPRP